MAVREISIHLPEELLRSLDDILKEESLTYEDVLIELIRNYIAEKGQKREMNRRAFAGEILPRRSISDIQLRNPEAIAKALMEFYGTDDAVKIVEMIRNRL
jgi:hypothetical protein